MYPDLIIGNLTTYNLHVMQFLQALRARAYILALYSPFATCPYTLILFALTRTCLQPLIG